MTIIMRFASIADMDQLLGIGKGEGTTLAVGQIDAILANTGSVHIREACRDKRRRTPSAEI